MMKCSNAPFIRGNIRCNSWDCGNYCTSLVFAPQERFLGRGNPGHNIGQQCIELDLVTIFLETDGAFKSNLVRDRSSCPDRGVRPAAENEEKSVCPAF